MSKQPALDEYKPGTYLTDEVSLFRVIQPPVMRRGSEWSLLVEDCGKLQACYLPVDWVRQKTRLVVPLEVLPAEPEQAKLAA